MPFLPHLLVQALASSAGDYLEERILTILQTCRSADNYLPGLRTDHSPKWRVESEDMLPAI